MRHELELDKINQAPGLSDWSHMDRIVFRLAEFRCALDGPIDGESAGLGS